MLQESAANLVLEVVGSVRKRLGRSSRAVRFRGLGTLPKLLQLLCKHLYRAINLITESVDKHQKKSIVDLKNSKTYQPIPITPDIYYINMKILFVIVTHILLQTIAANPNLQIGTGGFGFGCGSNSPAAQVPFSFVRLGPDTAPLLKKQYMNFLHYGGYSSSDHHLRAFSHMHLVGAGIIDMGIFGVLPTLDSGKKVTIPKDQKIEFFKAQQVAIPGYYKVDIENNITAQLTTTQRTGAHRYQFKKQGKTYNINFMTGYLLDKKGKRNSTTIRCGDKCLQGSVLVQSGFGGRFGGYTAHFHLKWSSSTKDKLYLFDDTNIDLTLNETKGTLTGAVIQTTSPVIELFVGISYVSIKNARLNLGAEVPQTDWHSVLSNNQKIWQAELSRFEISLSNPNDQTIFDTALYRTLLSPTLFNDANGEYLSFKNDGSISSVPKDMKAIYTDMSIWDVHRTQMPWLLFHDIQRFNDIAKSILLINRDGGYMPKWPFAQGWTGCMIAAHANTILADWVVKQAAKKQLANVTEILYFMLRNAKTQTLHDSRSNVKEYQQRGYIAFDNARSSSVSETLELSFNDFGISQVAGLLNQTETQKDFLNRSQFYKNVWNNSTKFFDPRFKNGSFFKLAEGERINILSKYYTEGDAWHYRFDVPHDALGLIELFGGKEEFVKQLNKFFRLSRYWPTQWLPNPYYWAGNEHNLFSVWLFSFAGRSDLTAKYSRMIMKTQYGLDGSGLPGNDDYGTMSAWFVFAALGFYPLPSTETYVLGSPIISSARIYRKLSNGTLSPFNIQVQRNSKSNYRLESVTLNGKSFKDFIFHSDLSPSNSHLTFVMQ